LLEAGLNAPQTSSMGRLFDGVASLLGVRHTVNYEAQAAIELEAAVDPAEGGTYAFAIGPEGVDATPVIRQIVKDLRAGLSLGRIAGRFHNGVANMVLAVCQQIREQDGLNCVALSGGVWQNMVLLQRAADRLRAAGFDLLLHRQVPANDGGLALGQAAIAAWRLNHDTTSDTSGRASAADSARPSPVPADGEDQDGGL
jgi:hydrogenase maturation protein HypF